MNYRSNIYESEYRIIGTDARYAFPHHDDSIEIIQTWSDGGYFIVKNNIFPIKPGSIFLINAMETHYSNPSDPNIYNRSKLIVSTDFFKLFVVLAAEPNSGYQTNMVGCTPKQYRDSKGLSIRVE